MQIQDAILQLLLKQPFYGYVASVVTPCENDDITDISLDATAVPRLMYNREWFEALSDEQAIGAVTHELLHLVLLHPFRRGSRVKLLWAAACDMAVNEHLPPSMLPDNAVTVSKIAGEFKENLPPCESAEVYYGLLLKNEGNVSFIERNNEVRLVLRSGLELKASPCSEDDTGEMNKNAVKSMLSEVLQQAEAEGEIPEGMEQYLADVYQSFEINWRNILKRFMTGRGKVILHKTCKRESKRFDNLPGSKRTVGTNTLLAVDASGSITESQIRQFHAELYAISRITGATLYVTQFDTECTDAVPLRQYIRDKKRVKGGGTDFRPVFHLADKMRIPLLIIFTDGDGTVPETANQKVLWVLTKGAAKPAAFGHCITFESGE